MSENDNNYSESEEGLCEGTIIPGTTPESSLLGNKQVELSKNQLRKLRKQERWQAIKTEKRKTERKKKQEKRKNCIEQGIETGPSRKQLKFNTMEKSSCKQRVVIDCSFDEYMNDKDIKMLIKQIQHSYSANRRAVSPLQLYVCGVNGRTKKRLEDLGDYRSWDVHFQEEDYDCVFDKDAIVYLSSESPNILEQLEDNKCYVIGGLVDHNHHKGLCHRLAEEKNITHAQLPISQYMDLKARKVLTINHVFEILLRYTETKNWGEAFLSVIPQRKGGIMKDTNQKTDAAMQKDGVGTFDDNQNLSGEETIKEEGKRSSKLEVDELTETCLKHKDDSSEQVENGSEQKIVNSELDINNSEQNVVCS